MYKYFAIFALVLIATPIYATSSWCAVSEKTSDGFINLRSGPGVKHSVVGKVIPSDVVFLTWSKLSLI